MVIRWHISNKFCNFKYLKNLKTSLRAAKDKQWGRMRPAGLQFDMPGLWKGRFIDFVMTSQSELVLKNLVKGMLKLKIRNYLTSFINYNISDKFKFSCKS
jgi:hypothetical protein